MEQLKLTRFQENYFQKQLTFAQPGIPTLRIFN
jgi:hypothetical protein